MKLIAETDERLKTACDPFDYNTGVDLKQLSTGMLELMMKFGGIGLAANQVGLPYNLFMTNFEPYLFVNPDIIDTGKDETKSVEGCLSFPDLFLPVYRKTEILLTYQDINGKFHTGKFGGIEAKVIQHECDHLHGITFKDRVSKLVLVMAEKKRKKFLNRR